MNGGYIFYLGLTIYVVPQIHKQELKAKHIIIAVVLIYPVMHYLYSGFIPIAPLIWSLGVVLFAVQSRLQLTANKVVSTVAIIGNRLLLILIGILKKNAYSVEFILGTSIFVPLPLNIAQGCRKEVLKIRKIIRMSEKYTYTLYLVHFTIMDFYMRVFPNMDGRKRFWITVAISEIAVVIFSWIFEARGSSLSPKLVAVHRRTVKLRVSH